MFLIDILVDKIIELAYSIFKKIINTFNLKKIKTHLNVEKINMKSVP